MAAARLPTREQLLALDRAGLERMLRSYGYRVDREDIRAAAREVYRRIGRAIEEGATDIDEVTWDYVDRRLENAFANAVRKQVKAAIRGYRLTMLKNVASPLRWIATLRRTCQSCLVRHGQEKMLDEWLSLGLPGSPALICDGNCNCELLPVEVDDMQHLIDVLDSLA